MSNLIRFICVVVILITGYKVSIAGGNHSHSGQYCSRTAEIIYRACGFDVKDDFWSAKANCLNINDRSDRKECFSDARLDKHDAVEECEDQFEARLQLCGEIGEQRYDPDFDPENFVDPREIGRTVAANPYFPLVNGNRWVYEGDGETITVIVTDKTKLIEGVTCVVVNDLVTEDGELVEDTDDWYAQDISGNVWYCGELSKNYESFEGDDPEEAELVDIDGSFKAGRDGAKPGILVKAMPVIGETLRQESALQEAEDVAQALSLNATASSPAASCEQSCLKTLEYTPIEPGVFEHKYYVPGVGMILEVDMEGNRVELVEFDTP